MNNKLSALIILALFCVSVALLLHAYGAYETAKQLTQPNIEALSHEATSKRVMAEVVPVLMASGSSASAGVLVESLAEQANTIHKLSAVQAYAQVRMAGIQVVGWAMVLLLSALLLVQFMPRRKSAV